MTSASSAWVSGWVLEHARRTPDAPAVDSPDDRLSYGVLARRLVAAGRVLRRLGVREGERVLVLLPNVPATVVTSLAIEHVGAVSVEASHQWTATQLGMVLQQIRPRVVALASRDARRLGPLLREAGVASALLVHRGAAGPALHASLSGLDVVVVTEAGEVPEVAGDEPGAPAPPRAAPSAVTLLLYTSGSTGRPRAVLQTATNILENTRSIASYLGLTPDDRAMLILPLSYCYGRSVLQTHLYVGGSVFLDPRFMYPRVVLQALGDERCTGFAGVPLTFELLRRQVPPEACRVPGLRYVTQAGGAMRAETIRWARAAFHPARLFVMYGQTEATARLAYLPPERAADKPGSIGIPIPGVELRVVDDAGRDVAVGAEGHLVARGPNVTPGYDDDPGETARVLRDGWLWTGDLARCDAEGFFTVVGRAKDILKVGGHRASPAQIESVLTEHPDVVEAAVAGVRDALMGEVPAALAVVRSGAGTTSGELRQFCLGRLPPYLVPRFVRIARELPRNASGKVAREEVARALGEPEPAPLEERRSP